MNICLNTEKLIRFLVLCSILLRRFECSHKTVRVSPCILGYCNYIYIIINSITLFSVFCFRIDTHTCGIFCMCLWVLLCLTVARRWPHFLNSYQSWCTVLIILPVLLPCLFFMFVFLATLTDFCFVFTRWYIDICLTFVLLLFENHLSARLLAFLCSFFSLGPSSAYRFSPPQYPLPTAAATVIMLCFYELWNFYWFYTTLLYISPTVLPQCLPRCECV